MVRHFSLSEMSKDVLSSSIGVMKGINGKRDDEREDKDGCRTVEHSIFCCLVSI